MNILNKFSSKKVDRKNFLVYTGVSLFGIFALLKFPFKLLRKSNPPEEGVEKNEGDVKIQINPDAVPRSL